MHNHRPYFFLLIIIINFFLFSATYENNNFKHSFKHIKKDIFNKITTNSIKTSHNLAIKNIINNNNLFKLRKLEDSTSITIIINGPKENAKILYEDYGTLPDHVYINDDSEEFQKINTINLENEGPNTIIMIWDSKIRSCINMFNGCSSIISIDLSNLDVSSISSMNSMFLSCSSLLYLNLTNFNTKSVKNMNNMFKGCSSLQSLDLSNFNTFLVTNMNGMFTGCNSLTYLDLSNFNTSNLKNMDKIFSDCFSLTSIDISNFDTKHITSMNGIFNNCSSLINLNLANFNTSLVTNMNGMFKDCSSLQNVYISNFNTYSVDNMNDMFSGCHSLLYLNITNFDTSLVTNMNSMFKDCSSLTSLDLSKFNTNLVNNMELMFYGCNSITSLNLANFDTLSLKTMDHIFNGCKSLKYLDISHFNTSSVKNMGYLFKNCHNLKSIDLSNFDTSSVTNMVGMFYACNSLEYLNLSNYKTSTVKSMFEMFINCINLKFVNLTNFIISSEANVNRIFYNCTSLISVDLTNFIVDDINHIFSNLNSINVINRKNNIVNEIINNIDELIQDKDINNKYIIEGIDYKMIIKPIDTYIEDSSVNIYLTECEKILKEKYPTKNFTIVQINLKNNNKNCLVDQVEYKIYDETKQSIDLSICKDIEIKIEYKIQNTSLLNMQEIKSFKEKGIDIFNINDTFFNDICYPYTDKDSNSDMILSDRISDIYQNYSICGDNCKYNSFNIEKIIANCYCQIKNELNTEVREGNFGTSIESAFLDSNFGVIKCYNLVFGIDGKLKNIGFWIFGIFTIVHIPTYIFYFINGINPVKNYIKNEMNNKGYTVKHNNLKNEEGLTSQRIETTKNIITNSKKRNEVDGGNNHSPPKRKKIRKMLTLKESKNDLNTIIGETDNISNDNSHKNEKIELKKTIERKKRENKNVYNKQLKSSKSLHFQKNNLISTTDLLLNESYKKKTKRFRKKKAHTININTKNTKTTDKTNEKENQEEEIYNQNNNENINQNNDKIYREFPLILINANNIESHEILKSNHKLNIYNYDEAIKYEKRTFFRIFFIYLIAKDNLLNIIFFNPPLELKPLRICVFIFNYACDLALNALFYLSKNISDKYHYKGANILLFSIINNITKSIVSTIICFILLSFCHSLIQSSQNIIKIFRNQENLLKKDKKYKVDEETKLKIENDIKKILKCLKIKIICFMIIESLFIFFFFYYVTAFCQVYQNTQVSWLLDSLSSYIISFFITFIFSLASALSYKISIYCKIKILYNISLFIYS